MLFENQWKKIANLSISDDLEKSLAALTRGATLLVLVFTIADFFPWVASTYGYAYGLVASIPFLAIMFVAITNFLFALIRVYKVIYYSNYSPIYKYFFRLLSSLLFFALMSGFYFVAVLRGV